MDMNNRKKILIVEDDIALNNGIVLSFRTDNYEISQAFSFKEGEKSIGSSSFDLILLDINLPDGSGLELCREIRNTSDVPIIFLTANDMEIDEVTGLELGGDDYITKPFSLAVLRARVSALLRRSERQSKRLCFTIDGFIFDFENMVFTKNGEELILSKTEQKLLYALLQNRGYTLTRDILLDKVWSEDMEFVYENALSVSIRRLRSKIEDNPSQPKYIQTVYGIGYIWVVKNHE